MPWAGAGWRLLVPDATWRSLHRPHSTGADSPIRGLSERSARRENSAWPDPFTASTMGSGIGRAWRDETVASAPSDLYRLRP
jgi:hypothetical protein